jgi:RNA polymerase sigma-70 factor (ECF subfamily)
MLPLWTLWTSVRDAAADPSLVEGGAELERSLRDYVATARSAWPEFDVGDADFVRHVAERTPPSKLPAPAHAGDMLLACACARGASTAIAAFHQHYRSVIARVLSRRRAAGDVADDAIQTVFERLLVGGPAVAKIAEYKGTGPLRSWVSTAAATTLLTMRRAAGRRREQQENSDFFASVAKSLDPELLYMKERYKAEMENAITHALARLTDRQRALLRLHVGEHMSIDQLGLMYRVNRATAARWLAAARESLVTGARDDLRARLGLSDSECDSVVALVQSELQMSIARRLEPIS